MITVFVSLFVGAELAGVSSSQPTALELPALDPTRHEFRMALDSELSLAVATGDPFAKGSRLFHLYGGGTIGEDFEDVYTVNFGVGYFFLDNVSINLDANLAYGSRVGFEDAIGGGLDLLFRWHFLRAGRVSTYIDGGAGVIAFEHEFPKGGTNFSFTLQAGMGITYELDSNLILMGGAKWFHISNARIEGIENNIGFDAAMIYGGIMLPF